MSTFLNRLIQEKAAIEAKDHWCDADAERLRTINDIFARLQDA